MTKNTAFIKKQVNKIIEEKKLYPVYQPIVSLHTGELLGYEALSRISLDSCEFNIEELFSYAEQFQCLWNLEYICRKKALKEIKGKLGSLKLFLNVSPNIFNDERFKTGMTLEYLNRYNISPDNIIFEVCERTDIKEISSFQKTVLHYEKQNYQIAIDDFGKGYSGFNRIYFLHPRYVKIDMSLISNIDKDPVKSSLVEGFVKFCHNENILLIAEGIETKEELTKLIQLGVDYGQGYYIGKPAKEIYELTHSLEELIQNVNSSTIDSTISPSFFGNISSICKKGVTTSCETRALAVFEYLQKHPEITELCVIDNNQKVCGLLTKSRIDECFGGMYGFSLYSKFTVAELLSQDYLEVDYRLPIETVSRLALIRPNHMLYDAIIVSDNGTYIGIVTIKDLLEASVSIQVERALNTNPLTHLPGNVQIDHQISQRLFSKNKLSILYLDLDNFKAYNDVYGFENGDLMIKAVAQCTEEACQNQEFIGHIGGDDFVVISEDYNLEDVFYRIVSSFHNCLKELYSETDYQNEKINSVNRHGEPETFPLASLSGALFTNEKTSVTSVSDFSYKIALTKKYSKKHNGDYLQKTEDLI